MKRIPLIHQLNASHFRGLAIVLWLLAGALALWTFHWQGQSDANIRYHLVEQSKAATMQINQYLAHLGMQAKQWTHEGEKLSLQDKQIRERVMRQVNRAVSRLSLGAQGFGVLIARSGELLAYPDSRLLGVNILHTSLQNHRLLEAIVEQLPRGQLMTFRHPVTGKEQWMVLSYISSLDADLGLVIDVEELRKNSNVSYWHWDSVLFLSLAGGIILLGSWRFPKESRRISRRVFIVLSVCLLSFLSTLWYEALRDIPLNKGETLLVDRESAELAWQRNLEGQSEALDAIAEPIQLVVHSIHLIDANEIQVSGHIVVEGIYTSPPLQLQDTLSSQWTLQRQLKGAQVWHFVATVKQFMDYNSFPFDQDVLVLKFLPAPDEKHVLLIPMFHAYPSMAPQSLPAIATGSNAIGGWQIKQTYFSYQNESLYPGKHFLNLKYNMVIQRDLTGPLISHIMPLCVVSFLTYCMLLIWTKDKHKQSLWGFSTATVLQYCASLFFILVISHVALRESLNAQGVVFIEYFYFISYLQIIFIAIGSLLYTSDIDRETLDQRKSLLLKQWYWPCIFILGIAITLIFLQ